MSEIVFNPPKSSQTSGADLQSQIENLQTTLASLNQQVIFLQEALQERDKEIAELKMKLAEKEAASQIASGKLRERRVDETVTIIGALINLYKFAVLPHSNVAGKSDSQPERII
ncbi:hypothetical protein HYU95_00450 [Candidatus Daviesbacteria bacterium]|nr:hypothetical protein [Candidatus Daviesbacteria bacterium]